MKILLAAVEQSRARLCGMADIFISYTSSDREWAFWVGHELQALGHTPRIHEWEIPAGGDIAAWMEARHDAADHILCIVSSAYLTKPYSAWERLAAQWAAITDRPNFAVPVFVEPCKAPTLFAHLKRCDLYGLSEGGCARPPQDVPRAGSGTATRNFSWRS
jgi:TIR domain-containing protein